MHNPVHKRAAQTYAQRPQGDAQGKGAGRDARAVSIAEKGRCRGVEIFTGQVLGENGRVLGLLDAVFAEVGHVISHSLYHFRAPLRTLKPTVRPVRDLGRAA